MVHYGDITKINGAKVPVVDIVCGGSPCQDLSVAGKRAGLAGERSGLFMEQIRVIKEMREHDREQIRVRGTNEAPRPRFMVWENVPGALSSNKGEDFRAVLEETARIADETAVIPRPPKKWTYSGVIMGDDWSIAWRIHDAQFWGVPQRRKRIALVADFTGGSAAEVLAEIEGVFGDSETCGEAWEGTPGTAEGGTGKTVYCIQGNCIDRADTAGCNGRGWREDVSYTLNTIDRPAVMYEAYQHQTYRDSEGVSGPLTAEQNNHVRGDTPIVCIEMTSTKNTIIEDGVCPTLTARMGTGGNQVNAVLTQEAMNDMYVVSHGGFMVNADNSGIAHTLQATDYKDPQCVCYGLDRAAYNQGINAKYDFSVDEEKIGTQTAMGPGAVCTAVDYRNFTERDDVNGTLQAKANGGISYNCNNVCRCGDIVRRLTPLECERLQGFPDGWTDIGDWTDSKGKKHRGDADSPRYKALGNSIALPFWQWMARRMVKHLGKNPTMASLFSGIGGFELVFARAGCKPVWNSEIESYPEAVTRVHFGDDDLGIKGDYERYL